MPAMVFAAPDATLIIETGIKLNKSKVNLNKGKTVTLKATLVPANTDFKTVTWDSDDPNIAAVSSKGVIKAVSAGTCMITATSVNGKTANCTVTVLPQKVTSVKMGNVPTTRYIGQDLKIPLTVGPASADNKDVIWSSSNTGVATVEQDGTVTFIAGGKVTIKATAQDGSKKSASKAFTVKQYVSSISLNLTEISIEKGKAYTLKASVAPGTATNKAVTWSSNNTKIATVSAKGVVKGVANGTATITCRAKDGSGVIAQCTVTVKADPLASLKKGMTAAQFAQAYAVAEGIANKYRGEDMVTQLEGVASDVYGIVLTGTYSTSDPHYNDVYGVFILRRSSCAGNTRAVGLCLYILGIPYEHVNENQSAHQWIRAEVNGDYIVLDVNAPYIGYEIEPYKHPLIR